MASQLAGSPAISPVPAHSSTRIYRRVWWGSGETGVLTGRNTVSEASGGGETSVSRVPGVSREHYYTMLHTVQVRTGLLLASTRRRPVLAL